MKKQPQTSTLKDRLRSTPEGALAWAEAWLKQESTDAIWIAMNRRKINRTELARRLGVSQQAVTNTLNGEKFVTIRTLARYLHAMGMTAKIVVKEES